MLISFCRLSFCPQSVRVPSATLPTRTPRATTTSPWTATSRDTTTCRRSADPPPPGEHISDGRGSRASFPPPHFWDDFRPVLARKEQTLSSSLTIRAADHPQSSGEASVPLRNHFFFYSGCPHSPHSPRHCPSVGWSGTHLTVTDLSSRAGSQQAVVRKAGLWRHQRGFSCTHLP